MYRILFIFFGKWFDSVIRFLQVSGGFIAYLVSSGFAIILGFMMWATTVLYWVGRMVMYLCNFLDRLRLPDGIASGLSNTVTILSVMETANTFFPVVEMFVVMVSLVTLAGLCAVYGLVKSWIPTVSG